MTEAWRPVVGWETVYEVSDLGRVRRVAATTRFPAGHLLVPTPNQKGYHQVRLTAGPLSSLRCVHRLVAEAFLTPGEGQTQVDHVDGDKANNALGNLEWVSQAENVRRSYALGLHKPQKGTANGRWVDGRYARDPDDIDELAHLLRRNVLTEGRVSW